MHPGHGELRDRSDLSVRVLTGRESARSRLDRRVGVVRCLVDISNADLFEHLSQRSGDRGVGCGQPVTHILREGMHRQQHQKRVMPVGDEPHCDLDVDPYGVEIARFRWCRVQSLAKRLLPQDHLVTEHDGYQLVGGGEVFVDGRSRKPRPGGDSRHGDGIRPFGDKKFLTGGHEIGPALIAMLRDRRGGDARHVVILS